MRQNPHVRICGGPGSATTLVYPTDLTDIETGYKVFRREVLQRIAIEEDRFGVEPELTAKVARLNDIRLFEVGISYMGRTYKQGKKIGWRDGLEAAWCILKYSRR